MSVTYFETHNKRNGKPKTCKFCGKHVWWHTLKYRWFEPDGKTLHSDVCELRKQHFKDEAADRAEAQRQQKRA